MYFRNYGLQKMCLEASVKSPVYKVLQKATWIKVANTVKICTTAPSSYLLITVKEIELEKISINDM